MNCRSCHFVDDLLTAPGGGMRTYTDFAPRSPIPARTDGKTHAPRNSPPLVNATLDRPGGMLLHFDAEFNSIEDLVAGTFTGRNFGWLPGERAQAIAHIAQVVRGDDGSFDPSDQFGGLSYRLLFTGRNPGIPDEFRLPPEFRAFVGSATDQEIFDAVVKVVAAYVNGLLFSQTEDSGAPIRSPFDVFLENKRASSTTGSQRVSDRLQPAPTNARECTWFHSSIRDVQSQPIRRPIPVSLSTIRIRSDRTGRLEDVSGGTGCSNCFTGRTDCGENRQLHRLSCCAQLYRFQAA